ncbi:MAG: Omp28-related outer membrane protein [Bacteroidetes bacterium]|nr:Omp28-related outer membrane protein [Bacteroidota bacterium]
MKNLLYLLFIPILFYACEEVPPAIDFSQPTILLKDSTFIASVIPAAQHKAVLLEDITGVKCINCPNAAIVAKGIVTQKKKDSVIVIALYPNLSALDIFTRPFIGVPQLANDLAKQVVETLGVPSGLPNGYVDRKLYAGKTDRIISVNEWLNFVNQRLLLKSPVNIKLNKTFSGIKLTAEMNLQYTENVVSGNHKYALYIIEDSIVSTQVTPSGVSTSYVHNHALKHSFGVPTGIPLTAPLVPGRTFVKQFEYEVPTDLRLNHLHLICVVMDVATEEVINVREIEL